MATFPLIPSILVNNVVLYKPWTCGSSNDSSFEDRRGQLIQLFTGGGGFDS